MQLTRGLVATVACVLYVSAARQPPNIVLILADDMGWNDVGFHGSDQIPTPNLDALAYNGVILNQHYSPALCTPSRAALLTGKYPIHTGMQHLVILESEPWGLGLGETLLPEVLAQAGYVSHAVGKWHLGFYKSQYTPTKRGFNSHYGYWQGFHDYYNHSVRATYEPYDGYDMRRNLETDWSAMGKYSTDLFTDESVRLIKEHDTSVPMFLYLAHLAPHTGNMRDPFQAPDDVVAKFSHIQDPERRVYAAMVAKLDESVGEVVAALKEKDMLENSVIVFMSDNGAPTHGIHSNRGSNHPLRGIKNSAWEGGNRGIAAIWSPLLNKQQRVSNQMMYITDWLPTISSIAGIDPKTLGNIDGYDMWEAISENKDSPRKEFLYNIDDVANPYGALRKGDWKYVTGSATGERNNGWYGEIGRGLDIGYDTREILLSKTGVAISSYIIKKQIQQKIKKSPFMNNVEDEKEEKEWILLNESTMLKLRQEAEVICNSNHTEVECNPLREPCLFNVVDDPCEKANLAHEYPHMLHSLEKTLQRYRKSMIKARNVDSDSRADPELWNNTWACWYDEIEKIEEITLMQNYLTRFLYGSAAVLFLIGVLLIFTKNFTLNKKTSTKTISIFTLYRSTKEQNIKDKSMKR
ncbi:arylsulfatase B [Halyomorpha halys]|uniref:arylsulfatase B n=1 Tax=Halyomorpha halys TaxID=286706 RepID=UPI0006D51B98|nr:arylsulfatase B-like [Halyomorpha halys]XP_014280414.1 arylsulfatase B-like [Halyomorpha halys]